MALQAMEKYPDEVRLVYHHYPYSDYSYLLAEVLEAAGEQGKFWELHDRLVEHVPDNQSELDALVKSLGIDIDRLSKAIEEYTYREKIKAGKREAEEKGITDVGLFINGKEFQKYPGTFDDLCRAIDDELKRLGVSDG